MRWRAPTVRVRPALQLLALFAGVGLMQGALVRLGAALRGAPSAPVILFQLTGAIAAWAAVPVVQTAVLQASPPGRGGVIVWSRLVAFHLLGYAAFTLVHLVLLRAMRAMLLALSLVDVSDGDLTTRLTWEAQNNVVVYASIAGLFTVWQAWSERDRNARRAAALEKRLVEARLAALSAQVDPHFFFNALNTLSAVMYEDLPRTERLLASLGGLMRATLREESTPTWTLAEERAHTERYLELLTARFGDRLVVRWSVTPAVMALGGSLAVPRFSMQTLIENAVRHNASRREPLHVGVSIERSGGQLRVTVDDDGAGFASGGESRGHALDRLAETILLLHGEGGRLERASSGSGGARVTLRLPEVHA